MVPPSKSLDPFPFPARNPFLLTHVFLLRRRESRAERVADESEAAADHALRRIDFGVGLAAAVSEL